MWEQWFDKTQQSFQQSCMHGSFVMLTLLPTNTIGTGGNPQALASFSHTSTFEKLSRLSIANTSRTCAQTKSTTPGGHYSRDGVFQRTHSAIDCLNAVMKRNWRNLRRALHTPLMRL